MSVRKFCWLLSEAKVSKRDREWFPRWLLRYAETVALVDGKLSVTEAEVIQFSRSLRDSGTPAWQRLQAVRAVEAYRNLVLCTDRPNLQERIWGGVPAVCAGAEVSRREPGLGMAVGVSVASDVERSSYGDRVWVATPLL